MSKRKAARLMIALTILAWATQTLLHQWGYGQEIPPDATDAAANAPADVNDMQFVSASGGDGPVLRGTLEMRDSAEAPGGQVKISNVCRWSQDDQEVFSSVGDLTIETLSDGQPAAIVTIDQVRQTLSGAGMNVAAISFAGATQCDVTRTEGMPVDQPAPANDDQAAGSAPQPAPATAPPSQSLQSLRELLKQDLSQRLQIPAEDLEMTFNSADDNVLNLVQPYFTFNIYPRQVRTLGDVSWGVDITRDGQTQHALINATARAWQTQAVLERPLDYRQIIQESDIAEKRMLTDHLSDEPLLARGQAIGMQASRILKPGMVLTGDMVDPPLLAKTGELVTVSVTHGSVRVTAVARALEPGSFGETIRVRDESSNPPQVYDVTLTGPQTGTLSAAN